MLNTICKKHVKSILEILLEKKDIGILEIAKELKVHRTTIFNTLQELQKEELVSSTDIKARGKLPKQLFSITKRGKWILKEINKIEKFSIT